MPNRLELPDELNQLIEKREAERRQADSNDQPQEVAEDQRKTERRSSEG